MSTQNVYFTQPSTITSLSGAVSSLQQQSNGFPFDSVPCSLADEVVAPSNYTALPVISTGDPIVSSVAPYSNEGTDSYSTFNQRVGDRPDAMKFFPLGINSFGTGYYDATVSDRGLLVFGSEQTDGTYLHTGGVHYDGLTPSSASFWTSVTRPWQDCLKEMYAIGINVVEVKKTNGVWSMVKDSVFNQRLTPLTTIDLKGPAAGATFMMTAFDPTGLTCRGTAMGCGGCITPWNTYMMGEENNYFNFATQNATIGRSVNDIIGLYRNRICNTGNSSNWLNYRYGYRDLDRARVNDPNFTGPTSSTALCTTSLNWFLATGYVDGVDVPSGAFNQFNIGIYGTTGAEDYRYMGNNYSWIVELDPYQPGQRAVKRTALGRMNHENCAFATPVSGQPLVCYMGDDQRSEYLYKYVSSAVWDPTDSTKGLVAGDKYMNTGTLYVAQFSNAIDGSKAYGTGSWRSINGVVGQSLTYSTVGTINFYDLATAVTNARSVADKLGATRTDRPEWIACQTGSNVCYVSFTNNKDLAFTNTALTLPVQGNPPLSSISPRYYQDYFDTGDYLGDHKGNVNGGIFRWQDYQAGVANPAGSDIRYDHFLFGCAPYQTDYANVNLSRLDQTNCFSMPDTVIFGEYSGKQGYMFVCTDDDYMTSTTNAQVLCVKLPTNATVGDGTGAYILSTQYGNVASVSSVAMSNTGYAVATGGVWTYIGNQPQVERFLTGVPSCEFSCWTETPDGKTAFTVVQHPGMLWATDRQLNQVPTKGLDAGNPLVTNGYIYSEVDSYYPQSRSFRRPKSTIVAIQRKDGQPLV